MAHQLSVNGQKEVKIRLGRKQYTILATVADVEQDIIGWISWKNQINWQWSEFGDLYLFDS